MRSRTLSVLTVLSTSLIAPAAAQAAFAHTVAPGESLSSIAATDGLSVAELAAANGLSPYTQLIAGQTLLIPAQGAGVAGGSAVASSGVVRSSTAVVSRGSIAGRGDGDGDSDDVASAPESAATQPVGAAAEGSASGPPYPTPERVSSSEVGAIASVNGVPPALADAVGYQESGFNNSLVSSAGARGVMQILPGTWNWIRSTLSPLDPLSSASARDNVRGGVLLLRSLLRSTGGDPALAAAGYYQGLPSVRANGMYRDTQRYVDNVMALAHRFGGF